MLAKEYIARYLEELELIHCFGLSGANIEELFYEIHNRDKLKIILAKTEYGASIMALGQYLATKKIPVALTTSGPGILNTIPVLAEAYSSDLPLVLISGLIPQNLEGRGGFQDTSGKGHSIDIHSIVRPVTGFFHIVKSVDEIPNALKEAFISAEQTKKPSAIFIPKNIFSESLSEMHSVQIPSMDQVLNKEKILSFVEKWQSFTEAPLVILGEKLVHLKSRQILNQLINKLDARVALTPNAKGFYDHSSSKFVGMTGIMGNDEVIHQFSQSKNIILIGTEFDMLSRFGLEGLFKDKNVFVLNEKATSINEFVDNSKKYHELNGDIELLIESIEKKINSKTHNQIQHIQKNEPIKDFSFKAIVSQFSSVIEADANIFADAGNTGAFIVHNLILSGENLFHVFLGMGGMGNSIGACIGSAIGNQKRSYAFMGDGSFLMYGLELHTAVEHDLPVVFVVFNNNSHAMCSTRENVFLGQETGLNNFKGSFLGKGMEQMFPGLQSFDISTQEELESCLDVLPKIKGPALISLNISRDEQPPFRSFYKN